MYVFLHNLLPLTIIGAKPVPLPKFRLMTEDTINLIKILFIAFFGGIARYLDEYLRGKKFNFWKMLARVVLSGFFGWLGAELVGKYSHDFAFVAAGVAGFGGGEIANVLIRIFLKIIGKQTGVEVSEEDLQPLKQKRTKTKKENDGEFSG